MNNVCHPKKIKVVNKRRNQINFTLSELENEDIYISI